MKKLLDCVTERLKLKDVYPALAEGLKVQGGEEPVLVRKFYSAKSVDVEEEERAVVGVISTASPDRDHEIMDPAGIQLDDYNKNRVVLYVHDYYGLPIGTNLWIKSKRGVGLVAKTQFAPRPKDFKGDWLPDTILHLMKTGHLRAFSVGFVPLAWEDYPEDSNRKDGALRKFLKWSLLEYSVVPVPSNPNALMLMAKSGELHDSRLLKDMGLTGLEENKEGEVKKFSIDKGGAAQFEDASMAETDLGGGVRVTYGWTTEGQLKVRGLDFEGEGWTEEKAAAWTKAHSFIEEIVDDKNLEGTNGMPDSVKLRERVVELEAFYAKKGEESPAPAPAPDLAGAMGLTPPPAESAPPAPPAAPAPPVPPVPPAPGVQPPPAPVPGTPPPPAPTTPVPGATGPVAPPISPEPGTQPPTPAPAAPGGDSAAPPATPPATTPPPAPPEEGDDFIEIVEEEEGTPPAPEGGKSAQEQMAALVGVLVKELGSLRAEIEKFSVDRSSAPATVKDEGPTFDSVDEAKAWIKTPAGKEYFASAIRTAAGRVS